MKKITVVSIVLLLTMLTACRSIGKTGADIDSAIYYTNIPSITENEINAIEALKEKYGSFTYGHLLETGSFITSDGNFAGFHIKVCELLSNIFGAEFVPTYCDEWETLVYGLNSGAVDFTGCLTATPERKNTYCMSGPIAGYGMKVYTHIDSEGILKESDLNGLRVGFMTGTISEDAVLEHYGELQFERVDVPGFIEAAEMLRTKVIDAFVVDGVCDPLYEEYDFIQSKEMFRLVYTNVSMATADAELEPIISVINKYLHSGGYKEFFSIYEDGHYEYVKHVLYQSFTDEEKDYIEDLLYSGAKVDIGIQHDVYPVSFYNETERRFEGIVIDVLSEVSKITGIEFDTITTTKDTTLAEILAGLKDGEISVMTQLLYTDSRKNDYIWSSYPYLTSKYALLSKSELPNLENYQVYYYKIGTVNKSAHEEMFNIWFSEHDNRIVYNTTSEGFDALENGEIDLLMLCESMLLTLTNYREESGYKVNISFTESLDSLLGFNKNEELLRSIVDKTLAYVDIGRISNEWLTRSFDYSYKMNRMQTVYLSFFSAAALIMLIFMAILFFRNKRLGKRLLERTTTLSAVYSSIPDLLFCKDTECRFTSCNPSFEKYAGISESEIIGKTSKDLTWIYDSDMADYHMGVDNRVIARIETEVSEEVFIYPDKSQRSIEMIKAPLIQNGKVIGLLGLGRDVTERKKAKSQLQDAQQSFQTVLNALPMPIRIVDMETLEIVYVNGSLLELLEYDSVSEVCGKNIRVLLNDIMSDGTSSAERVNFVMRENVDPISIEMEYLTRTGGIVEAMLVTRQIDYIGRRSSLGIIKDLSAEKERARILLNAMEREKEANHAKSLFLANMSHEIRTPMNGIIGMSDLLLGEDLGVRQLQYVKDIKVSAESLLGIINDILDLSKISEGKLQVTPVDVDLHLLLENTVSMMSFSANSKGLEFIGDIQVGMPEYVFVDDVRLKQVIVNLLSNAVKFTKKGHVSFFAQIKDSDIIFEVRDTGIGIKQESLQTIFMAFEQADQHKNREIKGTGLGLSITKSLVELMGGRIWAESEYGAGTTFKVTIPYVKGDEAAVETLDSEFKYIYAPTAQVLLVDDIQTNLTVGSGLLRLCGITADVAISGEEAIQLVKSKDYDIVFMDHMMPEMDGVETMTVIRGLGEKYQKLPIVALTANAVNESKDFLLTSGMDDFLSKPIDKSMLMSILQKWLPANKIDVKSGEITEKASYTEILTAASRIEGLDIELALGRIGGMQDVLEASIKQVAQSIGGQLKKMDMCLSGEDLRGFAVQAHGLKGALANIGATHNSELAAELEIASKAENMPLCVNKFTVFADVMEAFAAELDTVFPWLRTTEKPQGESGLLMENIAKALEYLDSFEASDTLEALNTLDSFTFGDEIDMILADAINAIEAFNYDKAISLLKTII